MSVFARLRKLTLCYGAAGVGKTLSARRYAHWDMAEPILADWRCDKPGDLITYQFLITT